jgi:hypothetical protein
MATPQVGQLYTPSGAEEITQDFLDDLYLAAVSNGNTAPPTQPGTDWYALGVAFGNGMLIQYANQRIAEDNSDILSAQGQALEEKRIAFGLPEVLPSPSTGKIRVRVNGSSTIPNGRQFTLPNGLRCMASGTQPVIDNSEIDVIAIDTGTATNAKGGTKVKFISPPLNVSEEATVSTFFPLTGGTDEETDARKRQRILDRLRYIPGGGNWAGLRDIATRSLASIQDAFPYPALGGPSSVKVALVKAYDPENLDFSRSPNTAQVAHVRAALQSADPSQTELVVQAAADEDCNIALLVTIPDSSLSGGNGTGWSDAVPWPQLNGETKVTITAVANATTITVSALSTSAPIIGQTRIAWWSRVDRRFRVYSVIGSSGSAGARTLTLDKAMADSSGGSPQVGDYISPAAERLSEYGAAWLALMGALGPGENAGPTDARLPRSLRHPYVSVGPSSSLSFPMLKLLSDRFSEITSLAYGYSNVSVPTVPADVSTAPNVLRLLHFGIYKA